MRKTQKIAAVDFGTSKIVTIIARASGAEKLEVVGSGTVPYDGFSNGDWNTPGQMIQRLHDSIAAAELEARDKVQEVYVGVPGEYIRVLTKEAQIELNGEEVSYIHRALVQDKAAEELQLAERGAMVLHRSPAWFRVDDGKTTMSPDGVGKVLHALTSFIVVDEQFVLDIREMLGALDITILGFISPTLGEALQLPSADDRDDVCALIDCGYLSTEVSVIRGDAIIYHAMLPMGGGQITADLATELRIPMRAAEQIKRSYDFDIPDDDGEAETEVHDARGRKLSFPRRTVSKCIEATMDELCDIIDQTLSSDASQLFTPRSQLYITGGGINMMRGAINYLSEKTGRAFIAAKPRERSRLLASKKNTKLNNAAFSTIHGLTDLIFNCINPETEEEDASFGRKLTQFLRKDK